MRYVLEGEWTGYTSAQRRVVHREVISERRAKTMKLRAVQYTDGTSLILHVRPAKHRERVDTVHAYRSLIQDAEATGKSHVHVHDLKDA